MPVHESVTEHGQLSKNGNCLLGQLNAIAPGERTGHALHNTLKDQIVKSEYLVVSYDPKQTANPRSTDLQ
jgi:hypothetical protein